MARSAIVVLGALLAALMPSPAPGQAMRSSLEKLDTALRVQSRVRPSDARIRVIVQTGDVAATERLVAGLGGRTGRRLAGGQAVVAELAVGQVAALVGGAQVRAVSFDRPIQGTLDRTAAAVGARWVNEHLGFDGTGVGVAIIDSGVTRAHDDLGGNRVVHFIDFVNLESRPHDGYGHGTHVAGIIAGSGHDSGGTRQGIAPGAHLMVLKTLDAQGEGYISDAIAAIDYAIEQRAAFNIRVINLSVAAGVYESYRTDPLTLAAGRAVEAGIVVITAAGNLGRNAKGAAQYGGITAPGNAPWVLTVGASSHNGTVDRSDDTIAAFSSRGPSTIDLVAKPDLVAPGVGIESLADPGSTLFSTRPEARLWGTAATNREPYLRLSGTSMAAPVVTGTVALMLEANPALKPDEVKAILQASADRGVGYGPMAQGAGFLNARAAVLLAQSFADSPGAAGRLGELVQAYEPAEAVPAVPGEAIARTGHAYQPGLEGWLEAACITPSGCFDRLMDPVSGVNAPPADTITWGTDAGRPMRRRSRKKIEHGQTPVHRAGGRSAGTNGNAGVSPNE
jgi:serine protease AprX